MAIRILVVDDDPATTDLLGLLLRSYGYDTVPAHGGSEAVRLLREQAFDLVVLDLMMPGMDGTQVCKAVRVFSRIPIVMYSAISDPNLIADCLDAGADDFLVKPIPSEVLVAHLRTLIRRTTGSLRPIGQAEPDKPVLPSPLPF